MEKVRQTLELHVYQKNVLARKFYARQGFTEIALEQMKSQLGGNKMTSEQFMHYVELALKNLGHNQTSRYNIEGEIYRLMQQYSEAQITEKVKTLSFKK